VIESGELAPARVTIWDVPEKNMHKTRAILYPQSVLEIRMPDELFREEAEAMAAARYNVHLIDTEVPSKSKIARRYFMGMNCLTLIASRLAESERVVPDAEGHARHRVESYARYSPRRALRERRHA